MYRLEKKKPAINVGLAFSTGTKTQTDSFSPSGTFVPLVFSANSPSKTHSHFESYNPKCGLNSLL